MAGGHGTQQRGERPRRGERCESRERRGDGARAPREAIGRLEGVEGRAAGRIGAWQSYTRGSAERGAMPLSCRGPRVSLCGGPRAERVAWPLAIPL